MELKVLKYLDPPYKFYPHFYIICVQLSAFCNSMQGSHNNSLILFINVAK